MRGQAPEKDNSERYLLTYADLMNLLLILFIVLYCMATKDVTKGFKVLNGIAAGFNGTSSVASATQSKGSNDKNAHPGSKGTAKATDYSDFFDQLMALLKQKGLLNRVDVTDSSNEVVITLKDTVLFERGKADLSQQAVDLLKSIGTLMNKISFGQLLVEGHTDSDPIRTTQFRDNRQLSQMRAYNVTNIIESCGINPALVIPLGCGEYYPVAKNDTIADKAKNRRVELVILKKDVTSGDLAVATSDLIQTYKQSLSVGTSSAGTAKSSRASSGHVKSSGAVKSSAKSTGSAAAKK